MRRLRQRPRSDALTNQARRPRRGLGRWVYLALLAALALGIVNHVWGDVLIMRADGLVLRERNAVAAPSLVRVESVNVRPGQRVAGGDILLRVSSAEILDRIADLAARNAELAQSEAGLRARMRLAAELLPLAERRAEEAAAALARLDGISDRGLVPTARYEEALQANFDAEADRIRIRAEQKTLTAEIDSLVAARHRAAAALGALEVHYSDGVVRASVSGTVGSAVPSVGEVYSAGEPMLSVFSGEPYVLAYLPRDYLFSIRAGMAVRVSSGRHAADGVVSEILPVSEALPREFRTAFRPGSRHQLARIRFSESPPFPASATVRIVRHPF